MPSDVRCVRQHHYHYYDYDHHYHYYDYDHHYNHDHHSSTVPG